MTEEEIKIEASTNEQKTTDGVATIHRFSPQEKTMRALKKLGMFWLFALCSVPLPGAHFVLVPTFLILGIVMFTRVMKTDGEVLRGRIQCPACGAEVQLGKAFLTWPLKEICQGCVRVLRIQAKEQA